MRIEKFEQLSVEKQTAVITAGIRAFSQNSFSDAATDTIVREAGISKGLLFHYFQTKKDFYGYCLGKALERLTKQPDEVSGGSFYDVLFSSFDQKIQTCVRFPLETRFVNMASRETSGEVAVANAALFKSYRARMHAADEKTMEAALAALPALSENAKKARDGLLLYSGALLNRYLLTYQNTPEMFFENAGSIKMELKSYIDLMLYGILKEEAK